MLDLPLNIRRITDFLVGLLNTPSPIGYYVEGIDFVHKAFVDLNIPGLSFSTTPKGSLLATWKGQSATAPRGVTAHVDTLGLMVKEIKDSGRLKTTQLGGFMWNAVEFEGVTVRTHTGQRYRGTVLPFNPSTHVNADIRETRRTQDLMEIRLDAHTTSAAETRALGIEVGDFVFLDPRVEVSEAGFIRSRHLDNKAGVACVYGVLLTMRDAGLTPAQDTIFIISQYEETGHGGVVGLPIELSELLVIDMAAIGEGQNSDEYSVTICAKDSSGPYHFLMNNKLRRLAETFNIPAKIDTYPIYSSDGSAYWRGGGAGRVALIGPGVDASHAYERTHQNSLIDTTHLMVRYLLDNEL